MSALTSLFLAPADPLACPDREAVADVLQTLAISGRALGDRIYAAGEGFARHVVFAGCSPYLVMEPPADGSRRFCHVALHGPFATPRLVTGPNTVIISVFARAFRTPSGVNALARLNASAITYIAE